MDAITGFEIEYETRIYPSCSVGFFSAINDNGRYLILNTKITFLDKTVIEKKSGIWIYNEDWYDSFEELLECLPEEAVNIILFNIEIFRGL